jgi:outer membrane protein TolC
MPVLPEHFINSTGLSDLTITQSLLYLVNDNQAAALVTEAIENNHDLRATALRLKSSGLLLSQTDSARRPSVNAEYAVSRNNQTLDRDVRNNHRISLSLSWEVDIWGKLADRHQARELDFNAGKLDYQRAMDSLAARVLQAWLNIKANKMTLDAHKKRVQIYQQLEKTSLKKYQSGLGNLKDISTARSRTHQSRAGLTQAFEAHLEAIRDLELLLGRYPSSALVVQSGLPDVKLARPSIPIKVLAGRPDIQAAVSRAQSQVNDAKADAKELLPNIRLTGDTFRENTRLNRLGSTENGWNLLGSLLFPVFHAGRIIDEAQSAKTLAMASYQDAAAVVLQAMKEVENALAKERFLKKRLYYLQMALEDARQSSSYYESRFREGLAGIIEIHMARDQELDINFAIIDAKASRIINRIDIALALGTGIMEKEEP